MNERVLVDAIREELSAPSGTPQEELKMRASHYLEKICTDIYRLPLPRKPVDLLVHWLSNIQHKQALQLALGNLACLPPNPRRLKAVANQWGRFASCIEFPQDHNEQKYWAVRVIIVSYIHQFHRDVWERWHYNPNFWLEIQALCNGEHMNSVPDWAKGLKLTYQEDIENEGGVKSAYPNPGDIENFWVGALVREYRDFLRPIDFERFLRSPGDLR
jgi:hypothetical protein